MFNPKVNAALGNARCVAAASPQARRARSTPTIGAAQCLWYRRPSSPSGARTRTTCSPTAATKTGAGGRGARVRGVLIAPTAPRQRHDRSERRRRYVVAVRARARRARALAALTRGSSNVGRRPDFALPTQPVEENDHYAALGLSELGFRASPAQIKAACMRRRPPRRPLGPARSRRSLTRPQTGRRCCSTTRTSTRTAMPRRRE